MANRARKENESYESYRNNLRYEAFKLKEYLKGRLIWDSTRDGTRYVRQTDNRRKK